MSHAAHSLRYRVWLLALSIFAWPTPSTQAQTQASCTFKLFLLNPANPTNPAIVQVVGVNAFATVVGTAQVKSIGLRGFIRYSGGGVTYFDAPNAVGLTGFTARNNQGVSVGFYSQQFSPSNNGPSNGFMLSGSSFTPIIHPSGVNGTILTGINKYNSIVGYYVDGNDNIHGFKRWSNGSFISPHYPGVGLTIPYAINDDGTMVGSYYDVSTPLGHGFIYHNGQWATLDFPNAAGTELWGISRTGVIIGHDLSFTPPRSCLYLNGTFKINNVPNALSTNVTGISSRGLIAGTVRMTDGDHVFTATCQ
jgi:hypothetical protein